MSIRVFLVESNSDFLAAASCFLSMLPDVLVVGKSAGSDEAIISIQSALPDLVLLDIDLPPGRNGDLEQQLLRLDRPPHMALLSMHEVGDQFIDLHAVHQTTFVNKANFVEEIMPIIKIVNLQCSATGMQ